MADENRGTSAGEIIIGGLILYFLWKKGIFFKFFQGSAARAGATAQAGAGAGAGAGSGLGAGAAAPASGCCGCSKSGSSVSGVLQTLKSPIPRAISYGLAYLPPGSSTGGGAMASIA